jgi:hypothetical protein
MRRIDIPLSWEASLPFLAGTAHTRLPLQGTILSGCQAKNAQIAAIRPGNSRKLRIFYERLHTYSKRLSPKAYAWEEELRAAGLGPGAIDLSSREVGR